MLSLCVSSLAFFARSIDVGRGRQATLQGTGPPVVFSTGLYGTMPTFLYNDLFSRMTKNVTLVRVDQALVSETALEGVVRALGVDKVGLMAHSSFDVSILASPVLRSVVLCDPVVFPAVAMPSMFATPELAPPAVELAAPVLNIRAGRSYDPALTPIPEYLKPQPTDESLWTEVTVPGVGHADVLDDVWADMGPRFIPWMNGPEPPSKPFREWSREDSKASTTRAVRHAYRQQVADLALAHLLAEADVLPPAPED